MKISIEKKINANNKERKNKLKYSSQKKEYINDTNENVRYAKKKLIKKQ